MSPELTPPGLPALSWLGEPVHAEASSDPGSLTIVAGPQTDWFNDPAGTGSKATAPALVFEPTGDFVLSARVRVEFAGDFDAGVLCLWQDVDNWAKLCFEYSPQHDPMVVSVVTRGVSDDANAVTVEGNEVYLRVLRTGRAFAFHYSTDGRIWHFVRFFRLADAASIPRLGFLAQSPTGDGCQVTFSDLSWGDTPPQDLRSGE